MPKITFRLPNDERVLQGDAGESVMHVAVQAGIPGIIGECGGEMSCATCHVYVPDEISARTPSPAVDEIELLETSDYMTDASRLACQIKVRPEFDGAEIRIPPQT